MSRFRGVATAWACGLAMAAAGAVAAAGEIDRDRYLTADDLRPGMKGFGRTVLQGTRIETFELEILDVLRNAFGPRQDIILVRCSGLNLEHTGIIGGMSGSPCYIRGADGRERMIGAVAYGWSFSKDPICGLQPIAQMLEVGQVRDPSRRPRPEGVEASASAPASGPAAGGATTLEALIARAGRQPLAAGCRYAAFAASPGEASASSPPGPRMADQLVPLRAPLMVAGVSGPAFERIEALFRRHGLTAVASGSAGAATRQAAADVVLEPGSALCLVLMSGDLELTGFGTCTEVEGDRVWGFGHPMDGVGWTEIPLATGVVHAVIPSMRRSNKIGSALRTVGTIWGDESAAVFGQCGPKPATIPIEVVVDSERGRQVYRYDAAFDPFYTPLLIELAGAASVYAYSALPPDHTVRYAIETEFERLGTFRAGDMTSLEGDFGLAMDAFMPAVLLIDSPFGRHRIARVRMDVAIEPRARLAQLEEVLLPRSTFKPGETVRLRVRWFHPRSSPAYSWSEFEMPLPEDIPDGTYPIAVMSSTGHLAALRAEKPHLFRVETAADLLTSLNRLAAVRSDRVYLRLGVPEGGLAWRDLEMPSLPSFRARILEESRRRDVQRYRRALIREVPAEFAVRGDWTGMITVDRRADQ